MFDLLRRFIGIVASGAIGVLSLTSVVDVAMAQSAGSCTVLDQNGAVAIVICPSGLDNLALRTAGEQACQNVRPCSAWIWDDPEKAPETAPPLANEISQDYVLKSVAIWDNDGKQLVLIDKVD